MVWCCDEIDEVVKRVWQDAPFVGEGSEIGDSGFDAGGAGLGWQFRGWLKCKYMFGRLWAK